VTYRKEIKAYVQQAGRVRLQWERETQGCMPLEMVPLPYAAMPSRHAKTAPPEHGKSNGRAMAMDPRRWAASEASTVRTAPELPSPLHMDPSFLPGGQGEGMGGDGEALEPWSDSKLFSLQQTIEQRRQAMGSRGGGGAPSTASSAVR
jgi:hypothetical protein